MENQEVGISCPKFQEKELRIKEITDEISRAEGQRKVEWAKKLEAEVGPLLACKDHDSTNLECRSCRLISQTRKRAAGIIIEVWV